MSQEEGVARALGRADLPSTFERWQVELAPGASRDTSPADWAGALVLVHGGTLEVEVDCEDDVCRSFAPGSLLALGWLPLRALHNRGMTQVELLAIRRRGPQPRRPFLRVVESVSITTHHRGIAVRYRTTILATGPNTTGIPVPEDVLTALGGGKRPPVVVTLGGHTYRSSIATMDGTTMVSLSAENRSRAGVAAGDEIEVELALDTAPREVTVPDDFAAALEADPAAKATFDALSYSNKRYHVEQVTGARSDETRQRRIAKSIGILREGRPR